MTDTLHHLLTADTLRRLAGQRSFERGEGYAARGRVRNLAREGDAITATVRGTHKYTATLGVLDGALEYDCNCPFADDGNFCKHCVALGLTWLEQEAAGPKGKQVTRKDVRAWLEVRTKKELVDLLLEQSKENERLDRVLRLGAARATGGAVNRVTFERTLDDALYYDNYVAWDEMYDYSRDIDDVLDSLDELIKEGHSAEVVELAETALARVESAMEHVDDSGGEMGMILDRLQSLHLKACKLARPDPLALAERLFAGEMETGFSTFHDAVRTYAPVLGAEGIARHRQLVEEAWARVPQRSPGGRDSTITQHYTITHMMQELADRSGDVDARVTVMSRDLAHPWSFLRIAELYRDSGRADDALQWAKRGLAAFPDSADDGLRKFLAEEYHRRNQHDQAMMLIWAIFNDQPGTDAYKLLKKHADRPGTWPEWREKALSELREHIEQRKKERGRYRWHGDRRDHSPLVEIFLWERKPEQAWQEAQAGGCTRDLWLKLAAKREKQHPEDALEVYRRLVDPIVQQKNKGAYREAVELMKKIRNLLNRVGRAEAFAPYVGEIRKVHRPKRNFMALIDAAGWPDPAREKK